MTGANPPEGDVQLADLRTTARAAGLREAVDPRDVGVELESADAILARLRAADTCDDVTARRRRRGRVLAAASVAAGAVLLGGLLQPWGSTPAEAATPSILDYEFASARSVVDAPGRDPEAAFGALATAAATAIGEPGRGGTQHVVTDSWYAEVEADSRDGSIVITPQITETWLEPDGSLRLVSRRDRPLAPDGRGLAADGAWDAQPSTADETQPPGSLDPDVPSELSRDPATLRRQLVERGGCDVSGAGPDRSLCLYEQVVELGRTYVIAPDLRAGIWRMLRGEEGFRLLGSVEDRAGRDGVGISLISPADPEYRFVMIVDPDDGALLGTEDILVRSAPGLSIEAPAITSFSAILESSYVD